MNLDELDALTTEKNNPDTTQIDTMDTLSITRLMNEQDALVAKAIAAELPNIAQAVDVIVERLARGGNIIYVGAGTSGRLGILDASECPPTFGVPAHMIRGIIAGGNRALKEAVEKAEDSPAAGAQDIAAENISQADIVVGITASGRTPYVLGAIEEAKRREAFTIGITCNHPSTLAEKADLAIAPLVGPEVIGGSTRMKAGTAQKMVLNMLSTAAMIRLGKTYGNLMVDVKATNEKLKVRARRILAQACDISLEQCHSILAQCEYEVKTAIVMVKAQVGPKEARQRLAHVNGFVCKAIQEA